MHSHCLENAEWWLLLRLKLTEGVIHRKLNADAQNCRNQG